MAIANQTQKTGPENIDINPESLATPEKNQENIITPEIIERKNTETIEEKNEKPANKVEATVKDEVENQIPTGRVLSFHQRRAQEIDKILADGLHDTFLSLNPQKQLEFKRVGDETVIKINQLLDKSKVKVDKIIDLIKKWLKIIPGINHFFLEQEAKIKADKIINIKDKA